MYRAVIIDDEKNAQSALKKILEEFCDDIIVVDLANNVRSGVELINKVQPQMVFLDIEMPDGTGFDLLEKIKFRDFSLIFCTGHNDFAIKAFKYNAIDYVLKPPDIEDIIAAVDKAKENLNLQQKDVAVKHLLSFYQNADKKNEKIILKTASDIYVVQIQDIYHCESDGSYTVFYTNDNKKITVSKNLKEYESILNSHNFIRIHQSHLINLEYVERLHKADGGYIVMKNGSEIPVSTRKKEALISALDGLNKK
ncbi:MAG: response regulator transcription factor [Bacteroidales bacterium]|nr:response regulator transcription factor [Bacteroidales bacterium]